MYYLIILFMICLSTHLIIKNGSAFEVFLSGCVSIILIFFVLFTPDKMQLYEQLLGRPSVTDVVLDPGKNIYLMLRDKNHDWVVSMPWRKAAYKILSDYRNVSRGGHTVVAYQPATLGFILDRKILFADISGDK